MAEEEATSSQDERARQLELLDATLRQRQIELNGKEKALDVKLETGEKLLADINGQIVVQQGRLEILKENVDIETKRLKKLQSDQAEHEAMAAESQKTAREQIIAQRTALEMLLTQMAQAREELAGVKNELKETQDYLQSQEAAVTDAMEAYNVELSACTDRIDQLIKQEATIQDNITTLDEREKEILTALDDRMGELAAISERSKQAQAAYDKGITNLRNNIQKHQKIAAIWEERAEKNRTEAEQFTAFVAEERKKLDKREADVTRQERELGEGRRKLTSDKAVLGAL